MMIEKTMKQTVITKIQGLLARLKSDDCQRVIVGAIWIAIFVFLFTVVGREKNKLSGTSITEPIGIAFPAPSITAHVSPMSEPNYYRVRLRWKPLDYPTILYKKTGLGIFGATEIARLTAKKHSFSDEKVEPGESYTYILTKNDGSSFEKVGRIELSIPLSLSSTSDPVQNKVKSTADQSNNADSTAGALVPPPNERLSTQGDI